MKFTIVLLLDPDLRKSAHKFCTAHVKTDDSNQAGMIAIGAVLKDRGYPITAESIKLVTIAAVFPGHLDDLSLSQRGPR